MTLKSAIVAQFRQPSGLAGALAGRIMAARPSNRLRNAKTVELLQLRPDSKVLEVGCGPGLALSHCADIVTKGRVVGLDHSEVMITQARKRLHKNRTDDRVELVKGDIDCLSDWPKVFDRIFSLNVIQFQSDKVGFFRAVSMALAPGGACLTTYQPRLDADGVASVRKMTDAIEESLKSAGFCEISKVEIIGGDVPAICIAGRTLGSNDGAANKRPKPQ